MRAIANARETEGQKMNLKQLIENYTRYCKVQGKTKATLKWYERRLGRFLKFMEGSGHSMLAKDVSMADGERYVMQLMGQNQKWAEHPFQKPTDGELSKYTVHGHVRAIRALTNWAYQQGYYADDPFANLPVPKLPKLLYEILTEEEITQMLTTAERLSDRGIRARTMLLVALDTGVRADELIGLKMDCIDFKQGTVKVFGKGQKERVIPLGEAAQREVNAYINFHRPPPADTSVKAVFLTADGVPLSYQALAGVIKRVREKSGIKRLHMHLIRHTSITMMIKRGLNAFAVQQFAGHSSIKTTEVYVHLCQQLTASEFRGYSVVDGLEAMQNTRRRGPRSKDARESVDRVA